VCLYVKGLSIAHICIGQSFIINRYSGTKSNTSFIITLILKSNLKTEHGKRKTRIIYGLDDRSSRVRFPTWAGNFSFATASRMTLGPTQPPIQWVPGALSLGVKRPGSEADHSHPPSAEVNAWAELYIYSPHTPSWRGAELKKSTCITLPSIRLKLSLCPSITTKHETDTSVQLHSPCASHRELTEQEAVWSPGPPWKCLDACSWNVKLDCAARNI
jgi:hypothetical protein